MTARAIVFLVSCVLVSASACSSPEVSDGRPSITADPSPASYGTTTVTWNTGDGSWGQVFLFVEGQDEALFVEGLSGSREADWISGGPVYDFRLYAGKDRKVMLTSTNVTRGEH